MMTKRSFAFSLSLVALCIGNTIGIDHQSLSSLRGLQDSDFQPEPRIINGENAPKGRYPWIVWYFFADESEQCGGSMIVRAILCIYICIYENCALLVHSVPFTNSLL